MKKTINISLAGLSFQIEEDAFVRLDSYLKEIKNHFASAYSESEEIINDIESRIAEQFNEKLKGSSIVQLPLVEELISAIGSVEQLDGENKKTTDPSAAKEFKALGKRLYRNSDDAIIAGVCSGLAAYIGNIDPVWIRLLFALSVFLGGFGVLIYVVLWLIVPSAKSETEKMQMRGEPVNLKNLEDLVKERVEEFKKKDSSGLKKAVAAPLNVAGKVFGVLGKIFQKFFVIIFKLIGVLIAFSAIAMIVGMLIACLSLIINTDSPYIDFPLKEIAVGWPYYLTIISAFFSLFVPLVFLTLLGTSLVGKKSGFNKINTFGLIGLWIISVVVLANLAFRLAPQVENIFSNNAIYQTESRVIDLKDFRSVESSSSFQINLVPAEEFKVMAIGRSSDLAEMRLYQENGVLKATRDGYFKFCVFCLKRPITLEIAMPQLDSVTGQGASKITAQGWQSENLTVSLSGASRALVSATTTSLNIGLSGASKMDFSGTADNLELQISGASAFQAEKAEIANIQLELSGASKAYFKNPETIEGEASGASQIYYLSAQKIDVDTSGASRLIDRD